MKLFLTIALSMAVGLRAEEVEDILSSIKNLLALKTEGSEGWLELAKGLSSVKSLDDLSLPPRDIMTLAKAAGRAKEITNELLIERDFENLRANFGQPKTYPDPDSRRDEALAPAFDYDEQLAVRSAYLAGMAYSDREEIISGSGRLSQEGLEIGIVYTSEDEAFQFFTAYDSVDDTVVASFRGTENYEDWAYNLDSFKTAPYPNAPDVYVHEGFYEGYADMKDEVSRSLAALAEERGTKKVKITGHSLGAAHAILLAYDIGDGTIPSLSSLTVTSLYTFGCPRVGDPAFSSSFYSLSLPHNRIVHNRDVVPHVPTSGLQAFEHTSREVWYDGEVFIPGGYVLCSDESGEDNECSRGLWTYNIHNHCTYMGIGICEVDFGPLWT